MSDITRKVWWYSLAVPLRLKSAYYHSFPPRKDNIISTDNISIDQLRPVFRPYHFSYAYYPHAAAFEKSMKLSGDNHPLLGVKQQDGNAFNPILVVLDALVRYNEYSLKKEEPDLFRFQKACDFLKSYAIQNESGIWIPYYQSYKKYNMQAPWVSGLTQALTLSVFLRHPQPQPDLIEGIFRSLWVPMEQGGVFTQHPSGFPWIAEYPGDSVPFVLNGQLSVIISLLEYLSCYPDAPVKAAVVQMINGFLDTYSAYRINKSIKYSWSRPKLASIHYKGLHAFQLVHLFQLTGFPQFRELAEEWVDKVEWEDFARFHFSTLEPMYFRSRIIDGLQY